MTTASVRRPLANLAGGSARALSLAGGFAFAGVLVASAAVAQIFGPPAPGEPVLTSIQVPNLPLGVVTFPNGKAMNLTVGLGSGAYRSPLDAPGKLWLVTDRGPAIPCAEAKRLIGIEPEAACGGAKEGSVYPLPGFVPSIYGIEIGADFSAKITAVLPLKGKSGRPVTGRPTPSAAGPKPEAVFGVDAKPLPADPSGVNPEALVRLSDGSFWVAETFGPSLLEIGPDGTLRRRIVPAGAGEDFKDSDAEIQATLPPIFRQRRGVQGFRALALSPDEQFLYTVTAAPLMLPDEAASRASRHLRILKIERASGTVMGQYLYAVEPVDRFHFEADGRARTQSDVKVVEMAAAGQDKLILLEQVDKSARFFVISLDEASRVPPELDAPDAQPSLEGMGSAGLEAKRLTPLSKTLVLESEKLPGLAGRIEAFAILSPSELVAINDNDFGIDGARTQVFRITLPGPGPDAAREDKARNSERK